MTTEKQPAKRQKCRVLHTSGCSYGRDCLSFTVKTASTPGLVKIRQNTKYRRDKLVATISNDEWNKFVEETSDLFDVDMIIAIDQRYADPGAYCNECVCDEYGYW